MSTGGVQKAFGEDFNIDTPDILYGWIGFSFVWAGIGYMGISRASEEYRWDGMGFSASSRWGVYIPKGFLCIMGTERGILA
jgi:hypothetical protein